jgi:dolichol-phosphate mannosyltransferase
MTASSEFSLPEFQASPRVKSKQTPTYPFPPAKVWMALPAYNEEEALPELLERIGETFADSRIPYEIIVVDDGSSDGTAQIVSSMSFQMPIQLVRHAKNQGLGVTLRDGLKEVVEQAGERDIIITMDADNTHPPGLIPRMVQLVHEGCDVVIASRFQPGARVIGVPFGRNILSIGARILFSIMFPTRGVRDYTSGYRAYRTSVVRQAIARYGDNFVGEKGFSCMAEVLLKLRKVGAVFGEVPLVLRYDQKGGLSKMKVLRTIKLTLSLLWRQRLGFK